MNSSFSDLRFSVCIGHGLHPWDSTPERSNLREEALILDHSLEVRVPGGREGMAAEVVVLPLQELAAWLLQILVDQKAKNLSKKWAGLEPSRVCLPAVAQL